jgi:hypothetical protein
MKNRKREICTSGSVRDEAGQPPHLLGGLPGPWRRCGRMPARVRAFTSRSGLSVPSLAPPLLLAEALGRMVLHVVGRTGRSSRVRAWPGVPMAKQRETIVMILAVAAGAAALGAAFAMVWMLWPS